MPSELVGKFRLLSKLTKTGVLILASFFGIASLLANVDNQFKMQPGIWQLTVITEKFEMAGISQIDIKKYIKPEHVVNTCLTLEMVQSPYFGVGPVLEGCILDRKDLGEGRFSATMTCKEQGSIITANGMIDASSIEYVGTKEQAGPNGVVSARARVTGKRVSDC